MATAEHFLESSMSGPLPISTDVRPICEHALQAVRTLLAYGGDDVARRFFGHPRS
jgi:hypothetical protein